MKAIQVFAVTALLSACSSAQAQVLEPPVRPARGQVRQPDPNRTYQNLSVGLDLLGGFDDNLAPESGGSSADFAPRPSGYLSVSTAKVDYEVGRNQRSVNVSGRSYSTSYRNVGLTPNYGGDIRVRARSTIGRRTRAEIRQSVNYDPFLSLGGFSVLSPDTGVQALESNPTTEIGQIRSWTSDTSAFLSQRWTSRGEFQANYGFNKRAYETDAGFDSSTHTAGAGYEHSIGRSTRIRGSYRHSNVRSLDFQNNLRPLMDHTAELGFHFGRNVTRTRQIAFSAGAGATYVDTLNESTKQSLTYWTPAGYANAQMDVGRSWVISANYRRGISMLQGLSPQQFVTDAAHLGVGGFLGTATDVTLSAGSSTGQTGASQDETGRFRSYSVTAQLRFAITRWWSAMLNYTRYRYTLNETASSGLGVSSEMNRNAIRVGLTFTLPLAGRD
jgi:hypothetical protein